MSANSKDKEISRLQQDVPVQALPQLSSSAMIEIEPIVKGKPVKDTKPFFLYPKDGLYGLL